MKRILLVCNGGFSTSMLVAKMQEAAEAKNLEVDIIAIAETDVEDYPDYDILLLGPQIGHRQEEFAEEFDMPVFVIDSYDYGIMNGAKVLDFAIEHVK